MVKFNYNLFGNPSFGNAVWWFQDEVPRHQIRNVQIRLEEIFGDQVVSLNRNVEWPPRSPYLTPCIFLWGSLYQISLTPPANIIDLRNRILELENLYQGRDMIRRAVGSMHRRARLCIQRGGGQVEGSFA